MHQKQNVAAAKMMTTTVTTMSTTKAQKTYIPPLEVKMNTPPSDGPHHKFVMASFNAPG
jgi:hypothetical protein